MTEYEEYISENMDKVCFGNIEEIVNRIFLKNGELAKVIPATSGLDWNGNCKVDELCTPHTQLLEYNFRLQHEVVLCSYFTVEDIKTVLSVSGPSVLTLP